MADKKNRCPVDKETIIDYLLNELSYAETVRMDRHIRECPECREKSESYSRLFGSLERGGSAPVSTETYFRLRSRIGETAKPSRSGRIYSLQQQASLILSAAAVLLITFLLSGSGIVADGPSVHSVSSNSWLIDSSTVSKRFALPFSHDTLFSLFKEDTVFFRNFADLRIKLKGDASTMNPDRLADHYHNTRIRAVASDFFPQFPQKVKIISYYHDYIQSKNRFRPRRRDIAG